MKRHKKLLPLLVTGLLLAACANTLPTRPVITSRNVDRLLNLPDAEAAADHAPIFFYDALSTVNDLELELVEQKTKEK
jgi:hypothetical protein